MKHIGAIIGFGGMASHDFKNLENYDVQTQLHIMKIRLKLEHQLGNFYKMGLKEHDFFIKPIQEKINKLPKYEDDNSSY